MTINRRTFIAGAAVTALTPALQLTPTQLAIPIEAADRLIFLIEGWSVPDNPADDVVSIRIDRYWRTVWR